MALPAEAGLPDLVGPRVVAAPFAPGHTVQRAIPGECGELTAFPGAGGMRPSIAQNSPDSRTTTPSHFPLGQNFLHTHALPADWVWSHK